MVKNYEFQGLFIPLVQMHRLFIKNITYTYVYVKEFCLFFCADVCQLKWR